MRITTTTTLALLLALGGCERNDRTTERGADESIKVTTESAKPAAEGTHAADNTGRNERDRERDALTPGDQAENESDRAITQRVRQGLMEQDELSTNAKNVKIITRDGVVTLRGPVDSAEEKALIAQIAQKASGVKTVENQLESKTPQ
jgi:hyperosmotically inducible protein